MPLTDRKPLTFLLWKKAINLRKRGMKWKFFSSLHPARLLKSETVAPEKQGALFIDDENLRCALVDHLPSIPQGQVSRLPASAARNPRLPVEVKPLS